LKTYNEQILT